MGIFDWWIDKTVKITVNKVLDEKLPNMIEDGIDKYCLEHNVTRSQLGIKERSETITG